MVVMIPICVVNGVAALITFGYVFVFWKGWCSKCKENPCWVAKAATEAAATQVEAVGAEIAKTMSSTEKTYEVRSLPSRRGLLGVDPSILRRLRTGRRRRTSPTPLRRRSPARARRRRSLPPRAVGQVGWPRMGRTVA